MTRAEMLERKEQPRPDDKAVALAPVSTDVVNGHVVDVVPEHAVEFGERVTRFRYYVDARRGVAYLDAGTAREQGIKKAQEA